MNRFPAAHFAAQGAFGRTKMEADEHRPTQARGVEAGWAWTVANATAIAEPAAPPAGAAAGSRPERLSGADR